VVAVSLDASASSDDGVGTSTAMTIMRGAADLDTATVAGRTVPLTLGDDKRYENLGNGGFIAPAAGDCWTLTGKPTTCPGTRTSTSSMYFNDGGNLRVNVASRMMMKEALHHAQCAYFVSIVVVQWADLLICKTRWLSIYHQGMRNPAMNFGLVFETLLAAVLCYVPSLGSALGTRPIRFLHWMPAIPFSIAIFLYDEVRKYWMRSTSQATKQGQQVIMQYSWIARNTYY
jgi:hypothetical protein